METTLSPTSCPCLVGSSSFVKSMGTEGRVPAYLLPPRPPDTEGRVPAYLPPATTTPSSLDVTVTPESLLRNLLPGTQPTESLKQDY